MTSTQTLLKRIAARAEADPDAVLPVLRMLAGVRPSGPGDEQSSYAVALEINRARIVADREEFIAHALTTEQVARHLGVTSRQAVAQRRARGSLLGASMNGTTYYPAWQFGPDGLAPGLRRLLAELPTDARTCDNIMRMSHGELSGRSLAQLFAAAEWELLLSWLRDIVDAEEVRGPLR